MNGQIVKYLPYVFVYLTGVLLSAVSQILLKSEANRPHKSFLAEYLNPRVICGYAILFGCTLFTVLAYRGGLPMTWGTVLESTAYIFVTVLGVVVLKEQVSRGKALALCIIMAGVVLFALG